MDIDSPQIYLLFYELSLQEQKSVHYVFFKQLIHKLTTQKVSIYLQCYTHLDHSDQCIPPMTVKSYLWTPLLSAPLPLWHRWPPAPPPNTIAWPLHQWQPIDLLPNPSLPSPLLAAKGRGATADTLNLHIMAVCVPQVNNSSMLGQWSLELSRGN